MKRGIGFGKIGLNIGQMKLGDKEDKSKDDSGGGSEAGFGSFGSFTNKAKDSNEITNLVNEEENKEINKKFIKILLIRDNIIS